MTMPKLDSMALLNPPQAKLTSFMALRAQPAMMGNRENQTYQGLCSPRMSWLRPTDSTGSAAFTTWAKLTAMREKDTQALTWPMVWNRATGASSRSMGQVTRGAGYRRSSHSTAMNAAEAASWNVAMNQGAGNAFSVCLFRMLNTMLKPYHIAM